VSRAEIAASPELTHIPGFLVEAVIEAPFGAHPTSHVPRYGFDAWSVMEYADLCSEGGGGEYIAGLGAESEAGYRERVLDDERRTVLASVAAHARTLEGVSA
jgi:glutaconate CoA-transferase subunit A